jgi:hypothetical protein
MPEEPVSSMWAVQHQTDTKHHDMAVGCDGQLT